MVGHDRRGRWRRCRCWRGGADHRGRRMVRLRTGHHRRRHRRGRRELGIRQALRQRQRKHTALVRRARHGNAAAQQAREVARNRQAQARAAKAPAGGAVGLVEGIENLVLLVGRDADPAVLHAERDGAIGRREHRQRDGARIGELDRVRQQVLEDLLHALAVGVDRCRHVGRHVDAELERLLARERLERARQAFDDAPHRHVFGHQFELARFDLRDVQNVVDQVQQVVAGRIDGLCEAHLLVAQVARRIIGQQLGQDQRAVQWRAQLVRHIGQELGLVAAGAFQFHGALLQLLLRRLQRRILHVQVQGLFGQLVVGGAQLGLLIFEC